MTFYDTYGYNNTPTNPIYVTSGVNATSIPAGTAADTVIKASAGVFFGILVTGAGVGIAQVYDDAATATGTIVGQIGAPPLALGVGCQNGIVISGDLNNPAMTVFWT